MRVAANRLATVAIVGEQLGFITHTNLPHFDTGLELGGQAANKFAKVYPAFGQIVDDDALTAKDVLDIDQLHFQLMLFNMLAALVPFRPLVRAQPEDLIFILCGHRTQNGAFDRIDQLGHGSFGGFAQDLADFQPAIRPCDHPRAAREVLATIGPKDPQPAHRAVSDYILHRQVWLIDVVMVQTKPPQGASLRLRSVPVAYPLANPLGNIASYRRSRPEWRVAKSMDLATQNGYDRNLRIYWPPPLPIDRYTMKNAAILLLLLLFVTHVSSTAVAQDAPPEPEGMQAIFNGQDLTGWDGDPRLWSVQDGVIRGETTAENKANGNTFLIWQDGNTKDFELRLSFRCNATNNSGIQYRSQHITDGNPRNKWVVRGYQHEIRNENKLPNVPGFIYEEGGPRGRMCMVTENVEWTADGKKELKSKLMEDEEFESLVKVDDWNDVVIIAKGPRIQHYLNGKLILDCTDNHPENAKHDGVLALQLHAGSPMWVEFKEIRFKAFE